MSNGAGSIRDALHEGVQDLLRNQEQEIIKVWSDDEEGNPEFCVTIRREGELGKISTKDRWRCVVAIMPPMEKVEWIDRKELESIVAAERARIGEEACCFGCGKRLSEEAADQLYDPEPGPDGHHPVDAVGCEDYPDCIDQEVDE